MEQQKNVLTISVKLENYDEVKQQLEEIKKLLQDIADINVNVEVKSQS